MVLESQETNKVSNLRYNFTSVAATNILKLLDSDPKPSSSIWS
jgi:hypothetical protein